METQSRVARDGLLWAVLLGVTLLGARWVAEHPGARKPAPPALCDEPCDGDARLDPPWHESPPRIVFWTDEGQP